ncbi:MAG: T9SS type A sorting domain-containing protein [Bacteroidetes bacterium]|nr:MAG: T9SS type A sorting domain-containing protein [Bacteroidota bacterium]
MKNSIFILLMISGIHISAQTSVAHSGSSGIICDSVNTIYAYTYLNHGAMFNVVAGADITLDHLTANIKNGTFNYRIYYKTGTFLGFETDPGAWTLIDSAMVTSVNNGSSISNQPTVIPIDLNLTMQAGDTIALYMMAPVLSSVYLTTTTTPWATEYSSNASLSISVARSVYQLFGTPFSTPQIWNGSVSYCETGSVGVQEISGTKEYNLQVYQSDGVLKVIVDENLLIENTNLEFILTDVLGKRLTASPISSSSTGINSNSLPKGIYICTVRNNEKVLVLKKVFLDVN